MASTLARKPSPTKYFSSCCGDPAEYLGYYRCTGCRSALNFGRLQPLHILGDPDLAARIKRERAEAVTPDGCLF